MTANATMNARSDGGTRPRSSDSTPSVNAMSVAIGMPKPRAAGVPALKA